jgi:hypothetical protein
VVEGFGVKKGVFGSKWPQNRAEQAKKRELCLSIGKQVVFISCSFRLTYFRALVKKSGIGG